MSRDRAIGTAIAVTIIFQHFQLASPGGYPLTLGMLSGVFLVLWLGAHEVVRKAFMASLVVLLLAAPPVFLTPQFLDQVEFLRTLALFTVSMLVIVTALPRDSHSFQVQELIAPTVLACLTMITALSAAQVLLGSIGNLWLFNPWRSHQYLYEFTPLTDEDLLPRAQGFFLEPSYDAFVIGTLTVFLLCVQHRTRLATILGTIGLLATQSATGLLLFGVLMLLVSAMRGLKTVILCLGLLLASYPVVGPYLLGRISSTGHRGSSAHYRLEAPLTIIDRVIHESPLGLPLGSIDRVVASFGLANGATRGTSLDNGYYVVLFYFGWVGAVLIVIGLCATARLSFQVFQQTRSIRERTRAIIPLWIAGSLIFSGGIMLPEFALMTWLSIQGFRMTQPLSDEGEKSAPAPSERDHCHT